MPITSPSRLFIDLIHSASGRWANWEPPIPVMVGDYGDVNRNSGKFERIGSIYDAVFEQYDLGLQPFQPQLAPAEEFYICTSRGVSSVTLSAGADVQLIGQAEASIQGQWKFGGDRGALLIISRPQINYLPTEFPYQKLRDISLLAHKLIVVDTVTCPAYALYLSHEKNEIISLSLMASGAVPNVPGVGVGGQVASAWQFSRVSGISRAASCSEYSFTPIFSLKTNKPRIFTRLRDTLPAMLPVGRDILEDAMPPWDNLDDDGEEDPIDD